MYKQPGWQNCPPAYAKNKLKPQRDTPSPWHSLLSAIKPEKRGPFNGFIAGYLFLLITPTSVVL